MRYLYKLISAGLLLMLVSTVQSSELKSWPPEIAARLESMIKVNAHKGEFAVFDMDNTSYRYDLTEALLPFLEMKGVLTRDNLDPALKLIPFQDQVEPRQQESLYSYYLRLCAIDDLICYPWIAQSFSGLSLKELKPYVDELMSRQQPITVRYLKEGKMVEGSVNPPRLFQGMVELYNRLQENGITVYVVTAANEELVRMVASDPRYGYNVKPENVIGVNTLLRDKKTGELTTSRIQISRGNYQPEKIKEMRLTSYLVNPMTWMEGKAGSILGWIDQWRKPVLVAGDTPLSDGYMLLNSTDISKRGIRLWVNKKPSDREKIRQFWQKSAQEQKKLGMPVTADKNWLMVTPEQIQ